MNLNVCKTNLICPNMALMVFSLKNSSILYGYQNSRVVVYRRSGNNTYDRAMSAYAHSTQFF